MIIFHDPMLFFMTYQTCKNVLLNFMIFHERGTPWQLFEYS